MTNETKARVHSCDKCGKDAVGCFRNDMDLRGLCFCAEHKEEVMLKYMSIVKVIRKPYKKTNPYSWIKHKK